MTFAPIALFWMLALWAVSSRRPVLLYLFFGSTAFGAFAVVPTELTAGLTFTATPIVTLLLVARAFVSKSGADSFLTSAIRFNRLGWLFSFWIVAIVTSLFLPYFFAGEIMVVPMRDVKSGLQPLAPTPQNISQLVYISISILGVFAFAKVLRSRSDRQSALKALTFGGAVVCATGLLDYASQFLALNAVLEPFRTATYALVTNVEVLGGKRVVGLMPEASTFGGLCLEFLALLIFFRRAIESRRVRNVYAPVVIGLLALNIWLSTSSSAYVGIAILAVVLAAEAILRIFSRGHSGQLYRQDLMGELAVAVGLVATFALLLLLVPSVMEPVYALIDRMVLNKVDSGSFEERALWRNAAWDSVVASWGLGIGLGSARASSSVVSVLSGTGILGGVLFYGFVLQTLLRRSAHMNFEGQVILAAFRFAYIPPFVVTMLVSGPDFGPLMGFGFGIVTAVCFSQQNLAARKLGRQGLAAERQVGQRQLPSPAQRTIRARSS